MRAMRAGLQEAHGVQQGVRRAQAQVLVLGHALLHRRARGRGVLGIRHGSDALRSHGLLIDGRTNAAAGFPPRGAGRGRWTSALRERPATDAAPGSASRNVRGARNTIALLVMGCDPRTRRWIAAGT